MAVIFRTDAKNPDFIQMVSLLDQELAIADGEDHAFYAQFDTITHLKHIVLAYSGKNPVGCGSIKDYGPGIMEIKRMFVRAPFRGLGIAGELLRNLESWSRELGSESCILETGRNNPQAIRLYEKNGYQRIENYGQYKGVHKSVCFKKMLNEGPTPG